MVADCATCTTITGSFRQTSLRRSDATRSAVWPLSGSTTPRTGSFRAGPDAEEMKAKLALLGLRAGVVAVTIDGTTWHRVRVGPYATARELDEARRTLSANGIEAIALREKQ